MSVSNDLMMAILAMDAYNRGYAPGIADLGGEGSRIGNAILGKDAAQLLAQGSSEAAGFYAASYTLNGQTVMSYRGAR